VGFPDTAGAPEVQSLGYLRYTYRMIGDVANKLDLPDISETDEKLTPPEVVDVARQTENLFLQSGLPNEPRTRGQCCGVGAEIENHLFHFHNKDIRRDIGDGGESFVVMLWRIHAASRNIDQDALQQNLLNTGMRPETQLGVFHHTLCVYKKDERAYVLDRAFCQFVNPKDLSLDDGLAEGGPNDYASGSSASASPVDQLLKLGYFELTEKTARDFLVATCDKNPQHQIPEKINVTDLLARVVPEMPDLTKEELDDICFLGKRLTGQ